MRVSDYSPLDAILPPVVSNSLFGGFKVTKNMQTHYDNNHRSQFIEALRERADKAQAAAASVITAGEKDEQELGSWKASNGVHCRHLPDDPQGILRLSIGGGEHLPVTMNYVAVRGKIGQCIELLEKALVALRECPE